MSRIDESEGRALFGDDAAGYHSARPGYPQALFDLLRDRGALCADAVTLDVGAGSGIVTRRLLDLGVRSVTALEPDPGFFGHLQALAANAPGRLDVVPRAFEDAGLADGSFDLAVVGTAFHWLDAGTRVRLLARAVRPGGFLALLWNLFQDPARPDPFHEATRHVLANLAVSPSGGPDAPPFALDRRAREGELAAAGWFRPCGYRDVRWTLPLDAAGVRSLYRGFSSVARLPTHQRTRILDELARIAEDRFHGVVERPMTSVLYLFERTARAVG